MTMLVGLGTCTARLRGKGTSNPHSDAAAKLLAARASGRLVQVVVVGGRTTTAPSYGPVASLVLLDDVSINQFLRDYRTHLASRESDNSLGRPHTHAVGACAIMAFLILVIGDIHIPDRALDIPPKVCHRSAQSLLHNP